MQQEGGEQPGTHGQVKSEKLISLKSEDLKCLPKALRYAYHMLTCFRFVTYGSWKEDGEPNPFVSRRAPKSPATRSEVSVILEDIEPFEYLGNAEKAPHCGRLRRAANGLMRPAHLRERRYKMAA